MEKSNFNNTELGILVLGKPINEYSIDRETWQPIFAKLLDNAFDGYGCVDNKELKKYIKTECGVAYRIGEDSYNNILPTVEDVLEKGIFVNCDEDSDYYMLNGKCYSISEVLEEKYDEDYDKYDEQFDTYWDALDDWLDENGYEDEDDIPYGSIVPYEIQCLKPIEPNPDNYKKVKAVTHVIPVKETNEYFENDVFIMRPFYWGECLEIIRKPNFIYKPLGLEITWYKYPLRSATSNINISTEEFDKIIDDCVKSLKEG